MIKCRTPSSREAVEVLMQVVEVCTHQVDSTLLTNFKHGLRHPTFELLKSGVAVDVDV